LLEVLDDARMIGHHLFDPPPAQAGEDNCPSGQCRHAS
jgi:hypothetical protein